jgi:formylglycine-generating enzyme required for sulfatase activity
MYGNAREWCADWYDPRYYDSSPTEDPQGPVSGSDRALRGGSWGSDAGMVGSHSRCGDEPDDRITHFGFRVARTP